jgi:hypothetical protein
MLAMFARVRKLANKAYMVASMVATTMPPLATQRH